MIVRKAHVSMLLGVGCGLIGGPTARADVKEVRLGVKGATCATCAFALRKAFKRLDGVADAQLTTKLACMQVQMKPGLWPDLPRMQRTIRESGFEAKTAEIELVVTGMLRKEGDKLVVELAGMKVPQSVVIEPAALATEIDAQLNHRVELKGHWKASENAGSGAGTLSAVSVQSQK